MFRQSQRHVLLLVLLSAIFTALFAVAVEQRFGEQLASVEAEPVPRDPTGRRLYILMVDSLTIDNAKRMPAFESLTENGFKMEIQPCFDNFTSACVREMLTGRRVFSLFSVLENLQITRPGVGENLMTDAQNAQMSTALLSWGDLRGWTKKVDTDHRFQKGDRAKEAEIGLRVATSHDLVYHHWIWHDVASHHHAKKNGPKYAESLDRTDELIAAIAHGLPEDMDLLVTGDHGHAADGRHVQGMDVPTVMVARSPNLKPILVSGRPPITSLRFIMGAITGLGSNTMQARTEWNEWLSDSVGSGIRNAATNLSDQNRSGDHPTVLFAVAVLLGVIASVAFGWRVGIGICVWMGFAGFFFPDWLTFSQNRGFKKIVHGLAWSFPIVGALIAFARTRTLPHAWMGATLGSVALCVFVWPGLFMTGALRNMTAMLTPVACAASLVLFHALWHKRSAQPNIQRWFNLLLCVGAVWIAYEATDFATTHFRITRRPILWALKGMNELKLPIVVGLGALVHRLMDADIRWSLLGGLAALLGPSLPSSGGAVVFAGFVVTWWCPPSVWRTRALSILAILIAGHTLTTNRQLGVLLTVACAGSVLHVIRRAASHIQPSLQAQLIQVSAAMVLLVTSFIGFAWTTRLAISGIDFTFAVDWLPGRLHKDLWWIVASATVLNCFIPLILSFEVARTTLGEAAQGAASLAARLSVLRCIGTIFFTTGWITSMGEAAASSRLRIFIQDGFIWLLLAIFLAGVSMVRRYEPPE